MTVFEMARELGKMLNESDQAIARDKAIERFRQDETAVKIVEEYENYQRDIEGRMQNGQIAKEELGQVAEQLNKLASKVRDNPVSGAYVQALNNFDELANQALNIVQNIIWGEEPQVNQGDGCGSGCGGCSVANSGCDCGGGNCN